MRTVRVLDTSILRAVGGRCPVKVTLSRGGNVTVLAVWPHLPPHPLHRVLGVLHRVPGVLRRVLGVPYMVLGVLRRVRGVLHRVLGVPRRVLGVLSTLPRISDLG